jgi:hypothetical protein
MGFDEEEQKRNKEDRSSKQRTATLSLHFTVPDGCSYEMHLPVLRFQFSGHFSVVISKAVSRRASPLSA